MSRLYLELFCRECAPQGGQIREALFARDGQHIGLDAVNFFNTDRVNLVGSEAADRGAAADVVPIPLRAARQ